MTTVLLAQLFGILFTAIGLGFLFNAKYYENLIADFQGNSGLTYLSGILTALLGSLIVLKHNIWEVSVAGLITLFGWGTLFKGLVILIFPKFLFDLSAKLFKSKSLLIVSGGLALLLGVYFLWQGFFVLGAKMV